MIPLRAKIPSQHLPVVTVVLITVNAVAFSFEVTLWADQKLALFYFYGLVPARYTQPLWADQLGLSPSYWPFLTSMFLHGGWMHIIGNMWSLWLFGDKVEDRMGHLRFLTFYLLCGLAAAGVHLALNQTSTLPVIGASGAVAGVMGAYFIMYPFSRIVTVVPIFIFFHVMEIPAFIYLGLWFLMQVSSGTMALGAGGHGGIAFWAHVGGFVMGILLLRSFVRGQLRRRWW